MHKPAAEWPLRPAEIRDGLAYSARNREKWTRRKEYFALHQSGLSWAEVAERKGVSRGGAQAEARRYQEWLNDPSELKALSPRTRSALERYGPSTRAQVADRSLPELMRMTGIGRKGAYETVLWLRGEIPD